VISLASSGPASAEPTDSRSNARSDTQASDTQASGSAAGSPTRRGADPDRSGQRALRPTRAAASVVASAAGAAESRTESAPTTRSTRGTPVSMDGLSVPVAEALVAPVPPRREVSASAAVPSASAAAPVRSTVAPAAAGVASPATGTATPRASLASSLQSLFCDPRGRRITIFKGTHFAIPNSFAYFTKRVTGTGTFTTDTVYDLKDEDQYDWNKFTGIAFTPLEPDRNSVMVGWRYNLTSKEFEIAPFYNVDKKRILPDEQTEVISVPAGETFDYDVDYTGVRISYGGKTVYKPYPEGLKPNVWTASRVSGWFGGNETAPRTLSYYLKIAR
jgi:hypothetical protein